MQGFFYHLQITELTGHKLVHHLDCLFYFSFMFQLNDQRVLIVCFALGFIYKLMTSEFKCDLEVMKKPSNGVLELTKLKLL